jgi:hypothetical protein
MVVVVWWFVCWELGWLVVMCFVVWLVIVGVGGVVFFFSVSCGFFLVLVFESCEVVRSACRSDVARTNIVVMISP